MSLEDDINRAIDGFRPPDFSGTHGPLVRKQSAADRKSFPRIATMIRRWALQSPHIRRVDLYHTSERYCVAVLAEPATIAIIQQTNRDLDALLREEFTSPEAAIYVIGREFADAPMFRRFGAETIIDKDDTVAHEPPVGA